MRINLNNVSGSTFHILLTNFQNVSEYARRWYIVVHFSYPKERLIAYLAHLFLGVCQKLLRCTQVWISERRYNYSAPVTSFCKYKNEFIQSSPARDKLVRARCSYIFTKCCQHLGDGEYNNRILGSWSAGKSNVSSYTVLSQTMKPINV